MPGRPSTSPITMMCWSRLRDKAQFDRDDLVVVAAWKFISMAHRKANATRYLAREPERRIQEITQRAFACNDDLGTLLVVDHLLGSTLRSAARS